MKAPIIGVDEQVGYYLRKYLWKKRYQVFSVLQKKSVPDPSAMAEKEKEYHPIFVDLQDISGLLGAIIETQLDESCNLAGKPEILLSWKQLVLTAEVNVLCITPICWNAGPGHSLLPDLVQRALRR